MALSYIQVYGRSTDQNLIEFNKYSTFVESLFYSRLPKVKLDGIRKIVIELLDKDLYESTNSVIMGESPICTLQKAFDYSSFFSKNSFDRKKILTKELYDGLLNLATELKWDKAPFEVAYKNIIHSNYESRALIGKTKINKGKKIQASIVVDQDIDTAIVAVIFQDVGGKDLRKVEIFKTLPQPFIYNQLVKNGRWISETDFELVNKSEEVHIVVSYPNDIPTVFFAPINRGEEGVIEEFNFLLQGNLPLWFK